MLGGQELGPLDFFPDVINGRRSVSPPLTTLDINMPRYHIVLRGAMEQALQKHGTIRAAASAMGMPKSTFADKAKAWGIDVRRKARMK
jgi:DNA-binding NtrC family response regulator